MVPISRQIRRTSNGDEIRKKTYRVAQVAYSDIQTSRRFVRVRVVDEDRLETVLEPDYPVFPIVLLRLLDWLRVDVMFRY